MLRDVNKNPRRWLDESGRVRVIEGWHPSAPDQVGYNLVVDGDWFGTFASVDDAATAAADCVDATDGPVVLHPDPPGGRSGPGLRLVQPPPPEGR
jgi:hypothetical protein